MANESKELARLLVEMADDRAAKYERRKRAQGAYGPGHRPIFNDDDDTHGPDDGHSGDGSHGGGGFENPMTDWGSIIYGGRDGGAEELIAGTIGDILMIVDDGTHGLPMWVSPTVGVTGLRYRTPVTTTAGGGDFLWTLSGELVESLEPLE